MPVDLLIDTTRQLIRTTCSGPICLANVIEHFRQLRDDPACVGCLLLDVREADSLPDSDQLRAVNSQLHVMRAAVEFGLCAIVVNRDAMFGMMRVFGVFAERNFRAIRVFRKAAGAEAWPISCQGERPIVGPMATPGSRTQCWRRDMPIFPAFTFAHLARCAQRSSSARLARVYVSSGPEPPCPTLPRSPGLLPVALVGQPRSPRRADLDATVSGFQLRLGSCSCCSDENLRTQNLRHRIEVHTIGEVDDVHHREHRQRESPSKMGSHRMNH